MWQVLGAAPTVLAALALTSCAAPSVKLYTLGQPMAVGATVALGRRETVIEIARVSLPDYLDTQDILIRRGSVLESSHRGRWASRLSLGATDLLTARLAQDRPDALVTDQPQIEAPSYRLLINISRLDIAAEIGATQGAAALDADWVIVPRDSDLPQLPGRIRLEAAGPVGTDQDVVGLEAKILSQLASAIDIARLR